MKPIVLSKYVAAPAERVFDVYTDLAKAVERIDGIVSLEVLTEGAVALGTRFRETRIMFKIEATEEMEFSQFDAPHSYTVSANSCGSEFHTTFRFTPDGEGTHVEMELRARATSMLAKLMSPLCALMAGTMKKVMDKDMEDLKRAAEAQA